MPSPIAVEARRTHWRGWAIAAYCVAVLIGMDRMGVAFDRERVIVIIVGGLFVSNIGRPWGDIGRVLFDWIPFSSVLIAYDLSRGFAHRLGRPIAYTPQIDAEKLVFFGKIPTVILEDHFYHHEPQWWDVVFSLIYLSHFIVPFVVAAFLWRRNWRSWRTYTTRFFALSFTAVVCFAIFPTAPPWKAALDHRLINIHVVLTDSLRGLRPLGLTLASELLSKSKANANEYAAIPSLHSAFALLVAITLWPMVSRKWRPFLAAYPLAMLTVLVYYAEHYAVDGFAGWALVAVVCLVERRTRASRIAGWDRINRRLWPRLTARLRPSVTPLP